VRAQRLAATIAVAALALAAGLATVRAADFYRGKTLTMVVGFAPGGGVDTTARIVGRHLARFIPGEPTLVVQNMEGAAGLVAMNYVDKRVAADGLTIAMPGRSWYVEGALHSPGVAFDVARLTYIGSPGGVNSALYLRTATGIDSLAALKASPRPVTFGSLGATTPTAMVPALLGKLGYPIRIIAGYVSTARVLVALEQGEIDGFWTVEDSFAARHDLIDKNIVRPLLQARPHLPGVPLLSDVVAQSQWALLMLLEAPDNFGLPLVAPAGTPDERAAVLRKAFAAMATDPAYQAEARRAGQPAGEPIDGVRLQAMVDELAKDATPDIVADYRQLEATK
jgi:tripartite-type tricarboxylate transporter receptor subunit TctC